MAFSNPTNNYHLISEYYDLLADVWSAGSIHKANSYVINKSHSYRRLLIIGPGTCRGFHKLPQDNSHIYLIDNSPEMLEKSYEELKDFNPSCLKISIQDFRNHVPEEKYDFIWFPFLLNVFKPKEVITILNMSKSWLSPFGRVYISDFADPDSTQLVSRGLQQAWHGIPMIFFHLVTGNAWHSILHMKKLIDDSNLELERTVSFPISKIGPQWIRSYECKIPL